MRRGTVRVVSYRAAWCEAFERERRRILGRGADLVIDVQHVGSTAVPGLPAKPIIDMALAVDSPRVLPALSELLLCLGWIERGDKGDDGGHLFVRESVPGVRTHHLHVVEIGGTQWRNYLAFRDMLRANERVRKDYTETPVMPEADRG